MKVSDTIPHIQKAWLLAWGSVQWRHYYLLRFPYFTTTSLTCTVIYNIAGTKFMTEQTSKTCSLFLHMVRVQMEPGNAMKYMKANAWLFQINLKLLWISWLNITYTSSIWKTSQGWGRSRNSAWKNPVPGQKSLVLRALTPDIDFASPHDRQWVRQLSRLSVADVPSERAAGRLIVRTCLQGTSHQVSFCQLRHATHGSCSKDDQEADFLLVSAC